MNASIVKIYNEPPFDEKEVLRYAGCRERREEVCSLLWECWAEIREKLTYSVCYKETELSLVGDICKIGNISLFSARLAKTLQGAKTAVVFCASVGLEMDRVIGKYARLSPSKAVMLQAVGAERVESLCDCFSKDLEKEKSATLTPRFSPGYGDLSMEAQKSLFALLQPEKKIGVYLNDSLLMSPTKSVTAIIGLKDKYKNKDGNNH